MCTMAPRSPGLRSWRKVKSARPAEGEVDVLMRLEEARSSIVSRRPNDANQLVVQHRTCDQGLMNPVGQRQRVVIGASDYPCMGRCLPVQPDEMAAIERQHRFLRRRRIGKNLGII